MGLTKSIPLNHLSETPLDNSKIRWVVLFNPSETHYTSANMLLLTMHIHTMPVPNPSAGNNYESGMILFPLRRQASSLSALWLCPWLCGDRARLV